MEIIVYLTLFLLIGGLLRNIILSVVFAVIIAALLLGEKISYKSGIGVVLIAAGAIFVALG